MTGIWLSSDGTDHGEDWFAGTLEQPVAIQRIVVGHGWSPSSPRLPTDTIIATTCSPAT